MARIETKTRRSFIVISLISSCLVAVLALWQSTTIVGREAIQKLQNQTQYQAQTFEPEINNLKRVSEAIETAILTFYPSEGLNEQNIEAFKASMSKYMLNLGKKSKPLSMWMVLNPDLVAGKHTVSYFDKERDGTYTREEQYSVNDLDLTADDMNWWTGAIKEGEVWTSPYYWENWDMELISYSKSVYIDSVFIGCIGSDFHFNKKRESWGNIRLYTSGYITLIDSQFNFIIHPKFAGQAGEDVMNKELYRKLVTAVSSDSKGHLYYKLNGTSKVMAFKKLSNGWTLIASIPVKEIYLPVYKITVSLLIILLIVILISIVIATLFSKSITSPIQKLVMLFMAAEAGDLSVRSQLKSDDELEKLGDRFNYFMSEMQQLIDQLKEQGNSLRTAKERAEESDRLKSAFLNNLSHELRTPLNAIVGFSNLLSDQPENEEEYKYRELIQENNDSLLKFIDEILIFSQLEQDQLEPQIEQLNLSEVFARIRESISHDCANTKPLIELSLRFPDVSSDCKISTDLNLLSKIINELLDNAFKFTNSGEIVVEAFEHKDSWGISVRDTGIGIPKEYHEQIFKKFFKYAPDELILYRGIGMGLSITDSLAKLLNGQIHVSAEIGKGSTFTIEFPYDPKPSEMP